MKIPNQPNKILPAGAALFFLLIVVGISVAIFMDRRNGIPLKIPGNSSSTPTPTTERPAMPSESATPGLMVYGTVRDANGAGLQEVRIYRNYASYPGVVIATTDASGYYESNFYAIPGDEMIGLWAEKPGFVFDPPNYQWRHYYGFEGAERDFLARQP